MGTEEQERFLGKSVYSAGDSGATGIPCSYHFLSQVDIGLVELDENTHVNVYSYKM